MPSPAPATYSDVIPLWQKCLQQNGLVVTCTSEKAALKLRYRLNGYRGSLRKQQSSYLSGLDPQLQHDQFEIILGPPDHFAKVPVIMRPRTVLNDITLADLDGNALNLDQDEQPDLL